MRRNESVVAGIVRWCVCLSVSCTCKSLIATLLPRTFIHTSGGKPLPPEPAAGSSKPKPPNPAGAAPAPAACWAHLADVGVRPPALYPPLGGAIKEEEEEEEGRKAFPAVAQFPWPVRLLRHSLRHKSNQHHSCYTSHHPLSDTNQSLCS